MSTDSGQIQGAPRRVRRRDIPRQGRRRARRLQRRPRALLVPRQSRDVEGLEGAALQDSAAGHGGNGRRQRVRQGRGRALARDQGPEMPVPRVLPGEEVHDEPPEAAGGQGAVRPCAGPDGRRRPPPGGALGGEVRGMVRLLGRLPRGEERGRRPHGVHPREAQEGAARPELAAVKRAALRVPRPGPGARGPPPEDQQQDRGRGELAAEGGPQEPQGAEPGAEGKGGLLVVLHAHRVPAPCRRDSEVDAHGRGHRPAVRAAFEGPEGPRRARVGRQARVAGIPPPDVVPLLLRLTKQTHFLSYKPISLGFVALCDAFAK